MKSKPAQTELAVLGSLSVEAASGYALRESIRDVLGHFWSESFGQIYPTLTALEAKGHVTRSDGSRAGSSVFTITDAGMRRLRELLGEPAQANPPRNAVLLRLFFGRQLGMPGCRDLLMTSRADAERRLATYEALIEMLSADAEHNADRPFWLLTVSAGQHTARATIAWATEALAVLDALSDAQTKDL